MSEKSQTRRDSLPVMASVTFFQRNRTKSDLNVAVTSSRTDQVEKSLQRSTNADSRHCNNSSKSTLRNFSFALSTSKNSPNKSYMKNSEKTIKPPEKPMKVPTKIMTAKPQSMQREKTSTALRNSVFTQRSYVPCVANVRLTAGKRSLTYDNLNAPKSPRPTCSRIDAKTIDELARRLENLQTMFINKLELFHSREPNASHKAYKLVAMVVGDNAKLLVKDSDAQRLPSSIPARSLEDLNVKISKFFTGCLIAFTDKLRQVQRENCPINCDEIYKELKRDEQVYSAILKDWVSQMYCDADLTLTWTTQTSVIAANDQCDFGTQTETELSKQPDIINKDFLDLIDVRIKNSELKLKLRKKEENHEDEIKKLKEDFESKVSDLNKSLQVEKTIGSAKDAKIKKIQELNESLSQQLEDTNTQLEFVKNQNEELNLKLEKESELFAELKKVREEIENIRQENQDLNELKMNFLRKLNRRGARIDILEKEVKQHKRKEEVQNKEIDDLKQEFDAKVKENREYKESLDARNQLIDHLRNAVEIEQRKRKELEENLVNTSTGGKKPVSAGIKFIDTSLEKNYFNQNVEAIKRKFNQIPISMSFNERLPEYINGPISSTPNDKVVNNKFDINRNFFGLRISKDSSDDSTSEKIMTGNERMPLNNAHANAVKKC